jgi:hypothetical protein
MLKEIVGKHANKFTSWPYIMETENRNYYCLLLWVKEFRRALQ